MNRCVIITSDGYSTLLLDNLTFDEDGRPIKGSVVNGGWTWDWKDGECQAKSGETIMNRWPCDKIRFVDVDGVAGGYNTVMTWAEKNTSEVKTVTMRADRPRCDGCGNEIDPDCCGCGDSIDHSPWAGHSPVPMGCDCGRVG